MSNLSELEGAVLGLLWSKGPLTAYAIRSHFLGSRSSHFSGSAGAIYPLVGRIERAGLLLVRETLRGKRASKQYSISAAGRKALRAWLTHVEDWMAAVEFDPIRSRVHFLGVLSADQRRRFVQEAADHLQAEILATEALVEQLDAEGDIWGSWGARGALSALGARYRWVKQLMKSDL